MVPEALASLPRRNAELMGLNKLPGTINRLGQVCGTNDASKTQSRLIGTRQRLAHPTEGPSGHEPLSAVFVEMQLHFAASHRPLIVREGDNSVGV
jgi:hypothetical protein